jgi:hypothetical protein
MKVNNVNSTSFKGLYAVGTKESPEILDEIC